MESLSQNSVDQHHHRLRMGERLVFVQTPLMSIVRVVTSGTDSKLLSSSTLKADLELLTGIPSDVCRLVYGERALQDIPDFEVRRTTAVLVPVPDGAILKLVPSTPHWKRVFDALRSGDVERIREECRNKTGYRLIASHDGITNVSNSGECNNVSNSEHDKISIDQTLLSNRQKNHKRHVEFSDFENVGCLKMDNLSKTGKYLMRTNAEEGSEIQWADLPEIEGGSVDPLKMFVILSCLCNAGSEALVQELLADADEKVLHQATTFKRTLMHIACAAEGDQQRQVAIIQMVIEAFLRAHAQNSTGNAEHIVDPFPMDSFNKSPLDVARERGLFATLRMLRRYRFREIAADDGSSWPRRVPSSAPPSRPNRNHNHSHGHSREKISSVEGQRPGTTTATSDERGRGTLSSISPDSFLCIISPRSGMREIIDGDSKAGGALRTPVSSVYNQPTHRTALLERRQRLLREFGKDVSGTTSYRSQSAKYYRSKYHVEVTREPPLPLPRPKTAGARYRTWKTWLTEHHSDELPASASASLDPERDVRNQKAFQTWLARKRRDERENFDDDNSDDNSAVAESRIQTAANRKAFEEFVERKKPVLEDLARRRRLNMKRDETSENRRSSNNRVGIFEIGPDEEPCGTPDPHQFLTAFQEWKEKRQAFEDWKNRQARRPGRRGGGQKKDLPVVSKNGLAAVRKKLFLDGITYEEWVGYKELESAVVGK